MIYEPRRHFLPFHMREKRWSCIIAHRRAGKTVACINELLTRALATTKHNARYAYICPFYSQAKTVCWDYLKQYSEPLHPEVRESELSVELPNGAKIRLFGADNPDALRGMYLDGVVLDEYGDMKPSLWGLVIRPMLADRKGWAVFIGTPKGHNHFYDIRQQAASDPDWFFVTLRASGTGILHPEELRDARKGMTLDEYEQEFECSFEAAIRGSYYGRDIAELEAKGRVTPIDVGTLPVFTAWDLGYSDDTAIWFFQVLHGEVRVIDYYANHGEDVQHYAGIVTDKPYTYGGHWLPHDAVPKTLAANGRSILQQLWELKIKGKVVPNLGLQDGIQAVRLMLPKVWFDPRCSEGIEALKLYQREWDDDKKMFRDKPRHDWTSHAADAFRYMALVWKNPVAKPEADKPRFLHEATFDEVMWAKTKKVERRI